MLKDDEKKALIISGGVIVLAIAWYLTRGTSVLPPGATAQNAPTVYGGPPGYTDYNVSPFNAPANATLGLPPAAANAINGMRGIDCCKDNSCNTAGTINTGNSPTGIEQLLNWYANDNPNFKSNFASQVQAYEAPPLNISELAALAAPSVEYTTSPIPGGFYSYS